MMSTSVIMLYIQMTSQNYRFSVHKLMQFAVEDYVRIIIIPIRFSVLVQHTV